MSLRPIELAQVVSELDLALKGAVVQRAHAPSPGLVYLELRVPGSSVLLCLSVQPSLERLSVAAARPPSPAKGSGLQAVLRKELGGTRLLAVRHREGEREVSLELEKQGRTRRLVAELSAPGALALLNEEGRVLAVHAPPARGLRVGAPFSPSPSAGSGQAGRGRPESRLAPVASSPFPFAEAAEALVAGKEGTLRADEVRRALLQPLRAKLTRTSRTLEKVRAEASRQGEAEAHRRAGELLSRNLHLVERGAREVRLTAYSEAGPVEEVVSLDPALPPKAQVERHFHQYRRLLRGCEHASRRAGELEAERARLAAEISRIEALPAEALVAPGAPAPPARKAGPATASPYREYRAANGERILVGKSAAANDELTFGVARPHDLWLHARGVPGSHVVIPLEKNQAPAQETLLDAAHLALHHSDAKGEPRGEVSYTQVKFVHRQKGGSPGQVTFTREKTLLVRMQPERLRRLSESVAARI